MAFDPKLEVYKLIISNKDADKRITFRDLFRCKFAYYKNVPKPITSDDIFKIYYQDFVQKIDLTGYNLNEKKKKGFTIAFEIIEGRRRTLISSPHNSGMIISGQLEGGRHGVRRTLAEIDDKEKKTQIHTRHIVNDRFYFLIYTPLDFDTAIVMVQGYTETKISDVFRHYLLEYFKYFRDIKSDITIYPPKRYRDKFLRGATFKKISFTTGYEVKTDFDEPTLKDYDLEIKIEIIDKSNKKTNYKRTKDLLRYFGFGKFILKGGREKSLSEFRKADSKMESDGKMLPIDIDDENNISPVILLKDENIEIGEGGVPNFDQINEFCRNLLEEIKQEIFPTNAIKEFE